MVICKNRIFRKITCFHKNIGIIILSSANLYTEKYELPFKKLWNRIYFYLFVRRLMSYLRHLYLFANSVVPTHNVLCICFICLHLVCHMLSVWIICIYFICLHLVCHMLSVQIICICFVCPSSCLPYVVSLDYLYLLYLPSSCLPYVVSLDYLYFPSSCLPYVVSLDYLYLIFFNVYFLTFFIYLFVC